MKRTKLGVAQLVFHLSSILQVVVALMAATVVAPLGFAPKTRQRSASRRPILWPPRYFILPSSTSLRLGA